MDKLTDRLALWFLGAAGAVLLFAGVAALVAAAAASGMVTGVPIARAIGGIVFQIGVVFVVAGGAGSYLARSRGALLPNERASVVPGKRPPVGGWLLALAVVLVALPAWLVLRLIPFLAEWRRVIDLLSASRILDGANANMSGVVLLPLAAALTPPFFELAALAAFVVAPAALLLLLVTRSQRFPRAYLVCAVLLSALVIASARGADAARLAGDGVEQLMADTSPRADEDAFIREHLARYTQIVGTTASVLVWALCGYLAFVPAVLMSQRVRTTFAGRGPDSDDQRSAGADLEAITSPPAFPG